VEHGPNAPTWHEYVAVLHGWLSPLHAAFRLLTHSLAGTEKEAPPHVFRHVAARDIVPVPHELEHGWNAPIWHWYVAVLHGWLSPLQTTLLLAHSPVVTGLETPLHVFRHVAARVIWPVPHDAVHWLNAPIEHEYVAQQGSAGHGVVVLWQLPGQSVEATWAPCWPPVVSKHAQDLIVEPVAPHEAVLHWPEFWHWHAYVLHTG